MALQKVEKIQWAVFCDGVSKSLIGKRAGIEIASLETGVQWEARWLPVVGLTYDPKDDSVQVLLDGLEHMIFHPREMYAEFGLQGLETLGIVDQSRTWQIVMLRDPLMLPPPRRQ